MPNIHYLHTPMAKAIDELPNRIRYWRKKRDLTLEEAGAKVGLSAQMFGMLERGERQLTDRYRVSIARALDVDAADLFLPGETAFTVPAGERDFWRDYLSLDAPLRNAVREHTRNLKEWTSQPPEEDEPKEA
jgi:transcriptional regulator with XRE-family HTH domain